MYLLFIILIIIAGVALATLFVFSKFRPHWYISFRNKADIFVIKTYREIYKHTHENQSLYKYQISQKTKLLSIYLLKKVYISLQYITRFVRRNIIMTAKKVQNSEPNQMLQELRKERDRIMGERAESKK